MNIFHLSNCPTQSAKWLCDKHVVKMMLESCQLLCTNYHLQGIEAPYKKTHPNHPSGIWCRESSDNFKWLIEHTYAISEEYTLRYGKLHACHKVLVWCDNNMCRLNFNKTELTKFATAISQESLCRQHPKFNDSDPVEKYRLYYLLDKKHLHSWKQNKPHWVE